MTQLILNPRFEQRMISPFLGSKGDDTVAASDLQDISYETLHELGTIEVEYDEDLCKVKSDDAVVGMSSQIMYLMAMQ